MDEKRQFPRRECNFKVNFNYYEGNPDELDINSAIPISGKGIIMDISRGGAFITSNSRVSVNMPLNLSFSSGKEKYNLSGVIARTGLVENNPSEIARRYAGRKIKGDAYIAVKFDNPIDNIPE